MRELLFIHLLLMMSIEGKAQDTIHYTISFPNHIHHEAKISLSIENIGLDSLFFRMSSSSPGRYASHQFAKNIYQVQCFNSMGKTIEILKIEPDCWLVPDHDGAISLTYTLFADYPDGTYAGIERDFALLNMPACILWWDTEIKLPIIIEFEIPDESSWKIGTQLKSTNDPDRFLATNLAYLMDSPVILSDFDEDTLSFSKKNGKSQQIRIIYNPRVDGETKINYTEMIRKVVLEQRSIFGEFPVFDFGSYIFLNNYAPGYQGDGMEHRNSTMITSPLRLPGNEKELISSVAHEFFHCWNVERIRPKSLEPFDFTRPNMSGELWFAEGFTSYYGALSCRRAGIYSNEDFMTEISNTLNYIINIPGRKVGSPVYMSHLAPFIDAARWIDEMNINNVYISYYNYGLAIGLALDLMLRSKDKETSLDEFMKLLWLKYGRDEIRYELNDLKNALIEITEDSLFAHTFFEKYIFGNDLPDYGNLLAHAGFKMKLKDPSQSTLGYQRFNFDTGNARLLSYPLRGDPLYLAYIEKGDEIVSLDTIPVKSFEILNQILRNHVPGDTLMVEFMHQNEFISSSVIIQQDPDLIIESELPVGQEESTFRESWLSSQINP